MVIGVCGEIGVSVWQKFGLVLEKDYEYVLIQFLGGVEDYVWEK